MQLSQATRTTCIALLFESGLGAGALAVGLPLGHWPAIGMHADSQSARQQFVAAGYGLAATLPMLAAMLLIDRFPIGPLASLRDRAREIILAMFSGASTAQLALVAIAAGFGEELLFRGLLQAGISRLIGGPLAPWIALAVASVLFGICHWLDTTYALLAMLAGAYFGFLMLATGSLWTPIVAHAAYDLLALIYLVQPRHLIRSRG